MKRFKITKREILYFILGIITMFIVDVVTDWDSHKQAFRDGMNDARKGSVTQQE